MSDIIDVTARSADQIAIEICTIREQVATTAVVGACQIGKRLEELKALVPFGEWGDFIKHRIGYSQRQCDNLMQLYREYGELGPKSKSIANLSPTAALKLLALPAGEREAFAEEYDAANLSVRKLEQKIKELTGRAEAAEASDKAGRILLAEATSQNSDLQERLSIIDADYRAQLDVVDAENDKLRLALEEAQLAPAEITAEKAERLRKEGAAAAAAAAQEQIAAAQAMQKAAEDDNADLKDKVRSLQEELRKQSEAKAKEPTITANPNYGAFKAAFEALVPAFQQVCKYAVAAADSPEQVTINRNAIKGLLLKLSGVADREVAWNGT